MQALWIVLTILTAALAGWPVTAGILRLAKTADVREAAGAVSGTGDSGAAVVSVVNQHAGALQPTALQPAALQAEALKSPALQPVAVPGGAAGTRSAASRPVPGPAPGYPAPDASLEAVPAPQPSGTSELTNPTVLRGGLVIGILERTAVVVAILADQPVAIAYIVAIKGLGRYPELKQTPAASERFIIGTLGSMLWAAGLATLAKWLLLG